MIPPRSRAPVTALFPPHKNRPRQRFGRRRSAPPKGGRWGKEASPLREPARPLWGEGHKKSRRSFQPARTSISCGHYRAGANLTE